MEKLVFRSVKIFCEKTEQNFVVLNTHLKEYSPIALNGFDCAVQPMKLVNTNTFNVIDVINTSRVVCYCVATNATHSSSQ